MNGLPRNLDSLERLAQAIPITFVPVEEKHEENGQGSELSVVGEIESRYVHVRVVTEASAAGKQTEIRQEEQVLKECVLQAGATGASASLLLPIRRDAALHNLTAWLDGQCLGTIDLPSHEALCSRALMSFDFGLAPYVFSGTEFPNVTFDRMRLEELIGPYTIQATFYDRDYHVVQTAEELGRYGVVLEVIPQNGRPLRRYHTLFRQAQEFIWWRESIAASLELPVEYGLDAATVAAQMPVVGNYVKERFTLVLRHDPTSAALFAGLAETPSETATATAANDVWAQDRQWWVGLKRKLSGMDQQYHEPFTAPRAIQGEAAPVLREGSLAEAGMQAGLDKRLDELCRTWAQDSDQAFAVCLARRGVVFFHRAYGLRYGQPMTVTTGSWMASITKLLAGTLLMMLVDQGRISLDEPVDTYLPALRDIPVETPLTVRHLMTHTNGLWNHVGDDLSDFEEIVADYYPYLDVGKRYEYNGAGCAVAGKVIEMVSGEALPQFYKRHLLEPLGARHTDVTNMSWDTFSIPLDIACIGQMLLNQGAYGEHQFFSPQTFQEMLPQRLTQVLDQETEVEYGIGTSWFKNEGLGEGTFGHGAASAATLCIDPTNELVIAMSRNESGRNFDVYHPQFLQLIADGIG